MLVAYVGPFLVVQCVASAQQSRTAFGLEIERSQATQGARACASRARHPAEVARGSITVLTHGAIGAAPSLDYHVKGHRAPDSGHGVENASPRMIRHTRFELRSLFRPNLLRLASLVSLAVCTNCADRLSGPEAVRLVEALESSDTAAVASDTTTAGQRAAWQSWWDISLGHLGDGTLLPLLRAASTVVLRRDGRPLTYRGFVFENVTVPPSECFGTRRLAVLWTGDDYRSALVFSGADFSRRIEPAHWRLDCNHAPLSAPEPQLTVSGWAGSDGEGDISRGVVISECPFLTPGAAGLLRERHSITCEVTRHQVRFRARLHQRADGFGRPLVPERPDTSEVELPSSEIIGIRLTVYCDGTERTDRRCPRKRRPSEPLAP